MSEAKSAQARGEMRFAVKVEFALRPEAKASFLALVLANAATSLREEADCQNFDVLEPLSAGDADVLLYEIYGSRAAFEAHLRSPHFRAFDDATRDMVVRKSVAEYVVLDPATE